MLFFFFYCKADGLRVAELPPGGVIHTNKSQRPQQSHRLADKPTGRRREVQRGRQSDQHRAAGGAGQRFGGTHCLCTDNAAEEPDVQGT